MATALSALWFVLKRRTAVAATDGFAHHLYSRFDPWVQTLRIWVLAAPVTFVYVIAWTVTTVILQGTPTALAGVLNRFNSTNLIGILNDPVRVLFTSAFIVADYGFFYLGYVVVFVVVVARLEQRIGSARLIVIGFGSHVVASLIIVGLEGLLIQADVVARSTEITQDVGVSYVMVGAAGGYLFLVGKRWRWWYLAGLTVGVLGPVVAFQTLWDLGHLLALLCGMGIFGIVSGWGIRAPLTWRQTAARCPPRRLPTWSADQQFSVRHIDSSTWPTEGKRSDDS